MGHIADRQDSLYKNSSDEQKGILEKFDDCYGELTDINERDIFVYVFKLGMRVAVEALWPLERFK